MSNNKYKSLAAVLGVITLIMIGCVLYSASNYSVTRLNSKAAWIAINDLEKTSNNLDKMTISDDLVLLGVVTRSMPKLKDVYLSKIIERERANTTHKIIEDLRKKSGQDLGNDPEIWIQKGGNLAQSSGSSEHSR